MEILPKISSFEKKMIRAFKEKNKSPLLKTYV
jgi:hypothetical protein